MTHKYGLKFQRQEAEEAYMLGQKRRTIIGEMFKERNRKWYDSIQDSRFRVFDTELDLARKVQLVVDDRLTLDTVDNTYTGVVCRETAWIILTYATLMGLYFWCVNIMNTFAQAPSSEIYQITLGPEIGSENIDRVALVWGVLYEMESSRRDFWNLLRDWGYKYCMIDRDLWFRSWKLKDGNKYYE